MVPAQTGAGADDETVLFCSATAWERCGAIWSATAPGLQPVLLHVGQRVSDEEIARIEIGFMSADLWPHQSSNFMRVATTAPKMRWFHTASAGVDHPVFGSLLDRGVRLTTSSGASATPIAHTVIMYLLAMSRNLPAFIDDQRRSRWDQRGVGDLEGRTVGVLGMGPIGREVARLAGEFGMRVVGMRRTVSGDEPCETWTFDRLHELLAIIDDLVLAVPATSQTRGMIAAPELAMMPPGSRLVNVGRGELLDEAALVEALRSGHIGAAALDVFTVEPLPQDSPLWTMANVIITPHSSGTTPLSTQRAMDCFTMNLGRYVDGGELVNEVRR